MLRPRVRIVASDPVVMRSAAQALRSARLPVLDGADTAQPDLIIRHVSESGDVAFGTAPVLIVDLSRVSNGELITLVARSVAQPYGAVLQAVRTLP